ncbi:MAG: hypothetical protein PWP03_157 [Candidatus Woesearchaeota archaeon]|nr:hypothetical protein [Candidatus Woesearchaeota archaeon]MDN5327519.1 hypothetical protein [Candidatus Woesearchaeota archaeon]
MCSYGLGRGEYKIFEFMLRLKEPKTIKEIAEMIGKERTTVQKAITKLLEKGLVKRRQMNLSTGGYVFVYFMEDKERIKKEIKEIIKSWCEDAMRAIDMM